MVGDEYNPLCLLPPSIKLIKSVPSRDDPEKDKDKDFPKREKRGGDLWTVDRRLIYSRGLRNPKTNWEPAAADGMARAVMGDG